MNTVLKVQGPITYWSSCRQAILSGSFYFLCRLACNIKIMLSGMIKGFLVYIFVKLDAEVEAKLIEFLSSYAHVKQQIRVQDTTCSLNSCPNLPQRSSLSTDTVGIVV